MYKITSIFLIVMYFLPFTVFLHLRFFFEYSQVLTILLAFLLGGFLIRKTKKLRPVDYKNFYLSNNKILCLTFFLYFILNINLYMDIFKHLFIFRDYSQWLLENTVARYAGELDTGAIKKISTILFIMYMIFLGAYQYKNKKKYYLFLFLLLVAETSALSRSTVLMGFIAFFIELLIRNNNYFTMIKIKQLFKIGLYVVFLLAVIFFFSAYFRIQNDENINNILVKKIGEYLIAHYEALYRWMQNANEYGNTYGFATFTAIYKIFTDIKVDSGFYAGMNTTYGHTVIYTTIRGFLSDFGYSLTVLIFFIFGLIIKYFSFKKMSLISYFFVRIILFFILYLFYSPFLFATVFIAYINAYMVLILINQKKLIKVKLKEGKNY